MKNRKTIFSIFCIVAFISFSMVLPVFENRNLKVLPNDISNEKLDSIMRSYTVALGVKCSFCHAAKSNTTELDFASDAEPMKNNARAMMRMVINIDSGYFYFDKNVRVEYLNVVNCKTCHRGEPIPSGK
jgi:hypothetical protein